MPGAGGGEGEKTANRYGVSFQADENVLEIDTCNDCTHCECIDTKCHWIVPFKIVILGTFLVVQWLRRPAPSSRGPRFDPQLGN